VYNYGAVAQLYLVFVFIVKMLRSADHDRLKARRHGIVQGLLDADTQAMLRRLSEEGGVPGSLCEGMNQLALDRKVQVEGEEEGLSSSEGAIRLHHRRLAVCEYTMDEASLSLLRGLSK
jgi:hypothetical protein